MRPKISYSVQEAIMAMAHRLGCDGEDILKICYFESKLNPQYRLTTHIFSPSGIILLTQSDALKLGTTVIRFSKMSVIEQLKYVEIILEPYTGRISGIMDVYSILFCPAFYGQSDNFRINFPRKYRMANKVFPIREHQRINRWQVEDALKSYFKGW